MTVVIRDADFKIVSRSRNLRGILDYSRKHLVERVDIWQGAAGGAQLGIVWLSGASVITDFACFEVCKSWCAARRNFPEPCIHTTTRRP